MLESVKGDDAARIFMSHLGRGGRGTGSTGGWGLTGGLVQTGGRELPGGAGLTGGRGHTWGAAFGGAPGAEVDRERDLMSLRGLDFLRHLARRFAELPYENISKIIKVSGAQRLEDAMRLPVEVVTDHIERNFGGTCFSLTFLFERVLESLGFDCYKVMADMNSGQNVHCLVVVNEGGAKYMVDPGYALYEVIALPGQAAAGGEGDGGSSGEGSGEGNGEGRTVGSRAASSQTASREAGSRRVACPHALVEVRGEGGGQYSLLTEDASGAKWRYRFRDVPTSDIEFERHWLESFGKPTLNNICLNRMTPRGHIYLRKDFFKFTSRAAVEKRRVREGKERLIEEEFGISAELVEYAQQLLDRKRAAGRVAQGGNTRG